MDTQAVVVAKRCRPHPRTWRSRREGPRLAPAFLAFALSAPAAAFDDGLLSNGSFEGTTAPWQHTNSASGSLTYSTLDATGVPGSGSALDTNYAPIDSAGDDTILCFTGVVPGTAYAFGGKILVEMNLLRTGYGTIHASFYQTANCSDLGSGAGSTSQVHTGIADVFYRRGVPRAVAPAGAVAARIVLHTLKDQADGTLLVHFDDVYFCPLDGSTCSIFEDGFEDATTDAWSDEVP